MDIIKGLERLQSRVACLIAETERTGVAHLVVLKSLYSDFDDLIRNPANISPDMLDQWALQLAHRCRADDDLDEHSYDTVVVALRLLSRVRRYEIDTTCGPDFAGRAILEARPAAERLGKAVIRVSEQAA